MTKLFNFNNMVLMVAFAISTIAEYYGILGLTAIFAGAFISTIIMGSILGIAKITITMWLRKYWDIASIWIKVYLVSAVIILSTLTCIGVFGHLSKAHLEQSAPIGDIQSKIELIDAKINTEKDNLQSSKLLLGQLDNQVNSALSRTDDAQGVNRSVQIRKQQAKERSEIQKSIEKSSTLIAQYNEEKAPLSSQIRKIEADVGPIKFLAAFIYGDNAEKSSLEAAVRWMIVLLVIVFDPLAIAMVLAATASKEYELNKSKDEPLKDTYKDTLDLVNEELDNESGDEHCPKCETKLMNAPGIGPYCPNADCDVLDGIHGSVEFVVPDTRTIAEKHPYLNSGFSHFKNLKPIPHRPLRNTKSQEDDNSDDNSPSEKSDKELIEKIEVISEEDVMPVTDVIIEQTPIETNGITTEPYTMLGDGDYVVYQGKKMSKKVVESMAPNLKIKPDLNFGVTFPKLAHSGTTFVRTDAKPYRLYKFVNPNWMEVSRAKTDAHLTDQFIEFLIDKIKVGEIDIDSLPENEQIAVEEYLQK